MPPMLPGLARRGDNFWSWHRQEKRRWQSISER
jgi:hypothetical protein